MKRILRKVASIFVATAMVAALGVSAMAAGLDGTGGEIGDNDPAEPLDTYIVFEKEITAYNPAGSTVNAPNITYKYVIASGSSGKTITDDTTPTSVTAQTKAGPTEAVSFDNNTDTISWSSDADTLTTDAAGYKNTKSLRVNFDPTKFDGPGVYRYEITENVDGGVTKEACGVIDGGISATRYLDVYVRDPKTNEEPGLKIYGYVFFQSDNSINATAADSADDALVKAGKTEGFVATTDPTDTTKTLSADAYYTYNLTVGKTVVNDSGHADYQFPFTVTFNNGTITQNIDIISEVSDSSKATLAEVGAAVLNDLSTNPKISDSATVTYTGIPCGTSVTIKEKNDVTTATYTSVGVITTGKDEANDKDADSKVIALNVESNVVTIAAGAANAAGTDREVMFTNTYELISPTGVALAILPFVILFTFGVGFLVAGTAKRKEDEA